jgi:class 3 adenylate cyclase/tetratricopeptide (TPR) repeat protein
LSVDPRPPHTEGLVPSPDLDRFAELLTEKAHDIWLRKRLAEGWRAAPIQDDLRKQHPNILPFSDLSESQKEQERSAVMSTLEALLATGYRIESATSKSSVQGKTPNFHSLSSILDVIRNRTGEGLPNLSSVCVDGKTEEWKSDPMPYRLLGEKFRSLGEPLLAYDVVTEGLAAFPQDVRLRQLLAFFLEQMGASELSNGILERLYEEGNRDEETLGLFARVQKDMALSACEEDEKSAHRRRAIRLYRKAYELSGGYWTGINAASLLVADEKHEEAIALAQRVFDDCREQLARGNQSGGDRYWVLVTLGEAALILGRGEESKEWYAKGVREGRGRYGDLLSTRRNLRLLADCMVKDAESLIDLFQIPRVIAFVGHMLDSPGRNPQRFPQELESAVKKAIQERLTKFDAGFGYSSAACGADSLFLEAMHEMGGETHIVLPFEKNQFLKESVEYIPEAGLGSRFERALQDASEVVVASGQKLAFGSASFEHVGRLLLGLAALRARQMETDLVPMAVWDGKSGDGRGGTADTIEQWRKLGHSVEVIDLAEILRRERPETRVTVNKTGTGQFSAVGSAHSFSTEIRSLLFADAVGFSTLAEEEIPNFVEHFLGLVADLAKGLADPPLLKNTWGDGLYFVFSEVRTAGTFALDLLDEVRGRKWKEKGLHDVKLRIGLHAGPVYSCVDPVTGQRNYLGTHVSQAARIEPITPPSQVYASQSFAALAAAAKVKEFDCQYVGQTALAKKYGTFPLYLVRRTRESPEKI